MNINKEELLRNGKEYLIPLPSTVPLIVKGEGLKVEDIDGKTYLDFMAGPGVLCAGHCHPDIVDTAQKQVAMALANAKKIIGDSKG